jgi:hypothetical protein
MDPEHCTHGYMVIGVENPKRCCRHISVERSSLVCTVVFHLFEIVFFLASVLLSQSCKYFFYSPFPFLCKRYVRSIVVIHAARPLSFPLRAGAVPVIQGAVWLSW